MAFYSPLNLSQCTYFPNCKHGDACLYMHEACKYKEKCSKFGCPYAHPFKSSYFFYEEANNPFEEMLKGYMMQQQNPFANKKKPKKAHPKPEMKNDGN